MTVPLLFVTPAKIALSVLLVCFYYAVKTNESFYYAVKTNERGFMFARLRWLSRDINDQWMFDC